MIRRPPRSTRTDTLFPYPTLFRSPEQCLVAHDELDLPAGVARLKFDGGHGGQNGLRDIIAYLGHGGFHRLRIGIGHPGHKDRVTPWVLGRPSRDDASAMAHAIDDALAVIDRKSTRLNSSH